MKPTTEKETTTEVISLTKQLTLDTGRKVREVAEQVPALIRQHPLQSLLIGFGVGFVSALAISRRK